MSNNEASNSSLDSSNHTEVNINIEEVENNKEFLLAKFFNIWRYALKPRNYHDYQNITISHKNSIIDNDEINQNLKSHSFKGQ